MPKAVGQHEHDRFFSLLIPADLSALSKARGLMEEVGRLAGLSGDRIFDLQVAVSEATANAIEHAASEVELAAWLLPDRVIVEITNDGAFQPGLYKDDEHRRRGLGLPLMVSLADQVHVSRQPEGKTRVSLTFFLMSEAGSDTGAAGTPETTVAQLETERLKVQVALLEAERRTAQMTESEERYRSLFENMLDGFAYCRMLFDETDRPVDFVYLAVNPAFDRLTGLTDVVGKRVTDVIPGIKETSPELFETYGRVALTGRPEHFELDFTPLDMWLSIFAYSPEKDHFIAIFEDIGERKRAEAETRRLLGAVQDEKERLVGLVDSITDEVWFADNQKRFVLANAAAFREFGFVSADAVGVEEMAAATEVYRPDMSPRPVEEAPPLRALAGEVVRNQEEVVRTPSSGELRHRLVNATPLRDAAGDIVGAVSVVRDITERTQAEEALRESEGVAREAEARYRMLFDSLIEGFCTIEMVFDESGKPIDYRFLEINQAFEEGTGLHDAQGRLMRDLAPDHDEHWFQIYGKVALTGEPTRFSAPATALGRHYDVSAFRIGGPESREVGILFNDVTEGKRAEEALRKSDERLRLALESAHVSAYETDRSQRYVWIHNPHPGVGTQDLTGLSSADVSSSPEVGKVVALRRHVMDTGTPARQEFTLPLYGDTRDYDYAMEPLRDESGEISGVLVAAVDITERKQAEAARERLLAQEQESAEELASANEELQSQFEELVTQGEELEAQTEELAAQNEEIRVAHEELTTAYEREREDARLRGALNLVGESLIASLDHGEILNRALSDGARALEAERAVLEVREGESWAVQAVYRLPSELVGARLSAEEASVATAMLEKDGVLAIEDAREDRRVWHFCRSGLTHFLSGPHPGLIAVSLCLRPTSVLTGGDGFRPEARSVDGSRFGKRALVRAAAQYRYAIAADHPRDAVRGSSYALQPSLSVGH
jgi:PAS domain S-box-containing protein